MELNLKNHSVLVTGSSRGIGKSIAESFLKEGARVMLSGRDEPVLQKTRKEFEDRFGPDHVSAFAGDLGKGEAISLLAEELNKVFSGLDALVCNIGSGRSVPPLSEDRKEWERMLEINLLSAVYVSNALLPIIEKSTKQPSILFISSIAGVEVLGAPLAYSAAKAALNAYGKNLARVLGEKGIRVNTLCPGNILFKGSVWERKLEEDPDSVQSMLKTEVPLRRLGKPEEIADLAVFLASGRASFITGSTILADGGQVRGGTF